MVEALAREYGLTLEEQKLMLPSAQQRVFDNRVAWAKAHMKMAALLENVRRGVFRITDRGVAVLGVFPKAINLAFLRKFPEYRSVREPHPNNQIIEDLTSKELETKTPAERLEDAYKVLRESLSNELLVQLKASSSAFFEKVVVEVLGQRDGKRPSPGLKFKSLPVLYKASEPEKAFLLRLLIF